MASREPRPPKMPAPVDSQYVGIQIQNLMVYKLAQIQKRDGLSRADLVRKIIADYLDREQAT